MNSALGTKSPIRPSHEKKMKEYHTSIRWLNYLLQTLNISLTFYLFNFKLFLLFSTCLLDVCTAPVTPCISTSSLPSCWGPCFRFCGTIFWWLTWDYLMTSWRQSLAPSCSGMTAARSVGDVLAGIERNVVSIDPFNSHFHFFSLFLSKSGLVKVPLLPFLSSFLFCFQWLQYISSHL